MRQARIKSNSGIYHVMMRGIDRQIIFEDREDADRFLRLVQSAKKRCGFDLYAYCLMDNHVHMIIREAARPCIVTVNLEDYEAGPGEPLENVIKRIGISYSQYFNLKYDRTGHLFQGRYKSEPIETEASLLRAIRYIHRNPLKAGKCTTPEEYPLSSYREYLNDPDDKLTDTKFVLNVLSKDELAEYTENENDDIFIDVEKTARSAYKDSEAKAVMKRITGCSSVSDFQKLAKPERDAFLRELFSRRIYISQISRITGVNREIVYRALKPKK